LAPLAFGSATYAAYIVMATAVVNVGLNPS
jgi:hypothetical protein